MLLAQAPQLARRLGLLCKLNAFLPPFAPEGAPAQGRLSGLHRFDKGFTFVWPFTAVVGIFRSMALLVCFGEHSEMSVYLGERGQPAALESGSLSFAQSENAPNLE